MVRITHLGGIAQALPVAGTGIRNRNGWAIGKSSVNECGALSLGIPRHRTSQKPEVKPDFPSSREVGIPSAFEQWIRQGVVVKFNEIPRDLTGQNVTVGRLLSSQSQSVFPGGAINFNKG
jgi:hypothetical protein